MLKAFWTWDPVSSGTYRAFDEPFAYRNNKWFFDKSVWQKMFRTMSGCSFNAMVLANTHPFPFMIDLAAYPDAKVVDDSTLVEYQNMHHWIFNAALDYDIAPYLLFFCIYYPSTMLEARGIEAKDVSAPTDFALEYTHHCTRTLLETYPELAGLFGEASENITDTPSPDRPGYSSRTQFLQQAIVDALDAARPDAGLYLRGWCGDPESFLHGIERRGGRPIKYSVKYTYEHLVDPNPDPAFTQWVEAAGASNVAAEFWISNFEPWTSFSFETVDGILTNLQDLGCDGFSLHPLSIYEWPHTSDTFFKYQWQRDLVWYGAWGGTSAAQMAGRGGPKWLMRNAKLIPGFEAGSRILELLALYVAGDKQNQWHPQFCSIRDSATSCRLFSIEDMLHLEDQPIFWGRNWWQEVTGDRVVHLAEYIESGTPQDAYGPEELIDELADLSAQGVEAGETGMRRASGEKELPSFARDAFCMGRLGEFYVERFRAALTHGRGNDTEALEHMARALGLYREIKSVDSSHRNRPFRAITGRCAIVGDWLGTVKALEAEYEDACTGEFKRGGQYPVHKLCGNP